MIKLLCLYQKELKKNWLQGKLSQGKDNPKFSHENQQLHRKEMKQTQENQ